jgi:hypothetical protein
MRTRRAEGRGRYRVVDGKHSIELKLRTPHQLFDERDPAPFRERDLDDDAARYLLGSFRDASSLGDVKVSLYFETLGEFADRPQVIVEAIHAFFQFEADAKRRELRDIFRQGIISLLIGLGFLFSCTSLAQSLTAVTSGWALTPMVHEGLAIMGWVAMWRPISIFLYEWWPIREALMTYEHLGSVDIDILNPNLPLYRKMKERANAPASIARVRDLKNQTSTV